jgi:hypothetical protein
MPVRLGTFTYENAGTGCLFSKYYNQGLNAPLTESSSRIQPDKDFPDDPYCGEFLATWVNTIIPRETVASRLFITRKRGHKGELLTDLYTFEWLDLKTGNQLFRGEAMRYKDMLVGAYM